MTAIFLQFLLFGFPGWEKENAEILESYLCILSGAPDCVEFQSCILVTPLLLDHCTVVPILIRLIFSLLDRTLIFPQNSLAIRDFICSWFKLVGQWFAWNYILMVY